MFKNKKAQISIEFLLVLSILVVGGVLFGVYYLQSIGKNRQEDVSTDVLDYIITDFASDINVFEFPEPPQPPTQSFSISLELDPNGPTEENQDFNVIVKAYNNTDYTDHIITDIYITDSVNNPVTNCALVTGVFGERKKSSYTNLNYSFINDEYTLTFNCDLSYNTSNTSETYNIMVFAEIDSDSSYNDFKSIQKNIYSPLVSPPIYQTFSIDLLLDPSGSSQAGLDFGLIVSVDNNTIYNKSLITKVEIFDEFDNLNPSCLLKGTDYTTSTSTYDNLKIFFEGEKQALFFNCSSPGVYNIFVSAEIDVNNYFSDTKTISKTITPVDISGCVDFVGDLIFTKQSGTYNNAQNLTLTYINDQNCQGNIYYTLDGSEPSILSNLFSNHIILNGNQTDVNKTIVKAKVIGKDYLNQDISTDTASRTYVFKVATPVPAPQYPNGHVFNNPINISFTSQTEGANIYYSLPSSAMDLSHPIPGIDSLYSTPINISETKRLNSAAYKTNYLASELFSKIYSFSQSEENPCPPMPEVCEISGSGTDIDPYIIRTPYQLYCVKQQQTDMSLNEIYFLLNDSDYRDPPYCYYKLGGDIDLNHDVLSSYEWYSEAYGFPSIGGLFSYDQDPGAITSPVCNVYDFVFYGNFNGDGHKIKNLYMSRPGEYVADYDVIDYNCFVSIGDLNTVKLSFFDNQMHALFGKLGRDSIISNLSLISVNLENISALTKEITFSASVIDVNIFGSLVITNIPSHGSNQNIGGLAKENSGYIRGVSFIGDINSLEGVPISGVGGILGINSFQGYLREAMFIGNMNFLINNSSFSAGKRTSSIGGISGKNAGSILNSKVIGNIDSNGAGVGGIVGVNNGIIHSSFVEGDIKGFQAVGGLVGIIADTAMLSNEASSSNIQNSYAIVNIFRSALPQSAGLYGGYGGLIGVLNLPWSFNSPFNKNYTVSTLSIPFVPSNLCGGIGRTYSNISSRFAIDSYYNSDTAPIETTCGSYSNYSGVLTFFPNESEYNYGVEPLSTNYLKAEHVNWDFTNIWAIDPSGTINNGYPYLRNNPPN